MPRVFIIHDQPRRNHASGEFESWRDFSRAGAYGDLVTVIPSIRRSNDPNQAVELIQIALADYQPEDYLLLVGAGEYLAFAGAVAARASGGPIRWLRYDGRDGNYYPAGPVDVYSDDNAPNS